MRCEAGRCKSLVSPSIKSNTSSCVGLQVVTQFTHLLRDCYPPNGIEPTPPFQNSASKVVGLLVHAPTPR